MSKIAIVVGHHAQSRGAVANSGAQEYDLNLILGRQLAAGLPASHEVRLFQHVPASSAATVLGRTIEDINYWGADVVVELHWNAVANADGPIPGSMWWGASFGVVWHNSELGKSLGRALATACAEALGTDDMGVAVRTTGYPMLRDTMGVSVLLETHNGLDEDSHAAFLDAVADGSLSFALVKALAGWVL